MVMVSPQNRQSKFQVPLRRLQRKKMAPLSVKELPAGEHDKITKHAVVHGEVNWGPDPHDTADEFRST